MQSQRPTEPSSQHASTPKVHSPSVSRALLERLAKRRPAASRYRIEREIAIGGMGRVLEVWDEDVRRSLAMKVLREDRHSDANPAETRARARFLEEAQITGQLGHPSIPPVHELGVDDQDGVYFTMPLVRGRDLSEILEDVHEGRPGWTLVRALAIFLKVCEALAYAHSKGVLHRDVKPSNIRVGRFGEVYVMDWGLARVMGEPDVHDLRFRPDDASASHDIETDRSEHRPETPDSPLFTMQGDIVGTPAYMSPEQAMGQIEELSPRSDIYSVGAMLYHLLTGHMPYAPSSGPISARAVLAMLLAGPPRPLSEVAPDTPPDLVAVCEKAMAREPHERYEGTLELAHDIEAFLERRPVAAQRTSFVHKLQLAIQRNKAVAATIGLALVVTFTLTSAFIGGLKQAAERERTARIAAEEARIESVRRGDLLGSTTLIEQEGSLYEHKTSPAMRVWVEHVDDLLTREAAYREERLGAEAGSRREDELAEILTNIEKLRPLREGVGVRLALAESLERRSIDDRREEWERAREAIASLAIYGGLQLEPQLGLVPLGPDPASRLWEFWVLDSGERPLRDADGAWVLAPETGVVLVLLPGGKLVMGSPEDEEGRIPEREARQDLPLELDAFFLGKYEVTQAQWMRVMGVNDSHFHPENRRDPEERATLSLVNPVENMSFFRAGWYARRQDLRLPTEAQWEFGARAGNRLAYHFGSDSGALEGRANVADSSSQRSGNKEAEPATWDDGYPFTAPVDAFEPNAFGLYGMFGNVTEWCLDDFVEEPTVFAPGDGRIEREGDGARSVRGGSWYSRPSYSRCAKRDWGNISSISMIRGLRVARPIR